MLRAILAGAVALLAILACEIPQGQFVQVPDVFGLSPTPGRSPTPSPTSTPLPLFTPTPTTAPPVLTVIASDFLNMRDKPDSAGPTNSVTVARLPAGTRVTWLRECRQGWAKISYRGLTGWASATFMLPEVCP